MIANSFHITTGDDHPVAADLYAPDPRKPVRRLVVLCHGFKGHRRWGFIPHLAERLCDAGIGSLALDFSHNGRITPGESVPEPSNGSFPDPDAFRDNTIARECSDLEAALGWIGSQPEAVLPAAPVGLWGHSRGGLVALIVARARAGIDAVATWSAGARPDRYTERQKARWRDAGALEFTDAATKTHLALGLDYLRDIEDNAGRYDAGAWARDLAIPHLIVHGEMDLVVPVAEAFSLYDVPTIRADKKLIRLQTGHTFGFEGDVTDVLDKATERSVSWFDHYLKVAE